MVEEEDSEDTALSRNIFMLSLSLKEALNEAKD